MQARPPIKQQDHETFYLVRSLKVTLTLTVAVIPRKGEEWLSISFLVNHM